MTQKEVEALNPTAEEVISDSATPAEEPKATEEVEQVDQPEQEESGNSGKGANQRIRELNKRAKTAEEKADTLQERLQKVTDAPRQEIPLSVTPAEFEPIVKDGEELTATELESRLQKREQRILQQAAQSSKFELQRQRIVDNIHRETNEVVGIYPQLDPDSDTFNKDVSTAITESTEAFIKANPTGSVKKFVIKQMKPYKNSVDKEVASQTQNIVKQAAETAVRPTNINKGEKSFNKLSLQEMEEQLGVVH